jgi:hypothetical protein
MTFLFTWQQTTLGKVRIYVQKHRFSSTPSNILFHGVLENLCFFVHRFLPFLFFLQPKRASIIIVIHPCAFASN